MFAASGAGGLAGAVSASRIDRLVGTRRVARYALACTAPFALLLSLAHRGPALTLFGVGAFTATFGIVLASVTFISIRQTRCPPELLGRVQAGSRLLMAITIPLGALAGGAIGQHLGPRTSLLASAIGYTVVGIVAVAGPLRLADPAPARPERAEVLAGPE
jgi:predicted MFS family arabinose efflux permease